LSPHPDLLSLSKSPSHTDISTGEAASSPLITPDSSRPFQGHESSTAILSNHHTLKTTEACILSANKDQGHQSKCQMSKRDDKVIAHLVVDSGFPLIVDLHPS
jgi:hypothetical protein